jgi:hypothetical protein
MQGLHSHMVDASLCDPATTVTVLTAPIAMLSAVLSCLLTKREAALFCVIARTISACQMACLIDRGHVMSKGQQRSAECSRTCQTDTKRQGCCPYLCKELRHTQCMTDIAADTKSHVDR